MTKNWMNEESSTYKNWEGSVLLTDPDEIDKRWREYFSDLLNTGNDTEDELLMGQSVEHLMGEVRYLNEEGKITKQVKAVTDKMLKRKSRGPG